MNSALNQGSVIAVCKKAEPGLPKLEVEAIQLIENYGVEGDYHAGEFVLPILERVDIRKKSCSELVLANELKQMGRSICSSIIRTIHSYLKRCFAPTIIQDPMG